MQVLLREKTGCQSRHPKRCEGEGETSMARPAVLTVADTIAKSLLLAAEARGDRPAIREKKFGIWQPTSWRQWLEISRDIAHARHPTRLPPGATSSHLANPLPEWVFSHTG